MTVSEALFWLKPQLTTISPTPELEAEILLGLALKRERLWLATHPREKLTVRQGWQLERLAKQRRRGWPLAYLVGSKEFFGRTFLVNRRVLIPRADSETLVETALQIIGSPSAKVLEIGTGSGCLAITLAAERPKITVTATELSSAALKVARENARQLNVADRIKFKRQNLLTGENDDYDLTVANLPYVESHWLSAKDKLADTAAKSLSYEPWLALHGGRDGLTVLRRFLHQFAHRPTSPQLLLEHGDGQAEAISNLIKNVLPDAQTQSISDLSGRPRVILVTKI